MNDSISENLRNAPSMSVFFPCYNEADAIETLVKKTIPVLTQLTNDFEIIIVNDGSADDTAQIADRLAAEHTTVKAIHHKKNSGYGAALQTGFRTATKELVFYTDGDAQFDITELVKLLPLIQTYDIVSCYRLDRKDPLIRKFNAFCWTTLVCLIFKMKIKDIDCAFKLFKRKIFDDLEMQSVGALIDAEILARATRKGYAITQIGVHHYPRTTGQQTGANINVILRAFKELFVLRKQILKSD